MKRALVVVGAKGMLGSDLVSAGPAPWQPIGLDLPQIDLTDLKSIERVLPAAEVVINCAAYTRVDDAETERDAAFAINADGAGNLARVCADRGIRLVQLSTDYVFPGTGERPYREDDPVAPVNAYGESKLAGEHRVAEAGGEYLIVRVQSLFGRNGRNFVAAIRDKLAGGARELRVVDDQVSSPTYTGHLARAVWMLATGTHTGIVHVRAAGHCSWHAFACAIARRVEPDAVVQAIPSSAYPTPARRPAYSVLDLSRFLSWCNAPLPGWQDGLDAYLAEPDR